MTKKAGFQTIFQSCGLTTHKIAGFGQNLNFGKTLKRQNY